MSRLDLVVFGATGYTGKQAVRELTQLIKKYPGLTWGVAGRSQGKLEKVLQEVSKSIDEDVSSVPTIVADVGDEQSLRDMCSRTRIVVNCCGPYRFYGELVVKAAVESRTHYVDVSGEPQFMELMQLKYNEAAREAGVYVVSACGFDSIPVDLGVIFLQQNFTGTVNSVETYLSASSTATSKRGSAVNYGTWESLVYGITHMNELRSLRKKLYPSPLPPLKPKLQPRALLHRHQSTGSWCLPFPGADASVAYRTQRALHESDKRRPAQVRTYVQLPSLLAAVGTVFFAAFTYLMTRTSFTRQLLLDYPAVFTFGFISKESPSEEVGRNTTFAVDLHARGWAGDATDEPPSKTLSARVSGVNPGYGMTVVALLLSALTVLTESDKMPSGGGVMTTGVAFRNTGLIDRLNDNNVKFQIV